MIYDAASKWEQAVGKTLFAFTRIATIPAGPYKSFHQLFPQLQPNFSHVKNRLYVIPPYSDDLGLNDGTLGFTMSLISKTSNRPASADIVLLLKQNSTNLNRLHNVALHELGHFLGLGHIEFFEDPASIMQPIDVTIPITRSYTLSRGDILRIQHLYGCHGQACDVKTLHRQMIRHCAFHVWICHDYGTVPAW